MKLIPTLIAAACLASASAAELNPAAVIYRLPDQIKWTEGAGGASSAVLLGDPSKPGLYIQLVK